MRVALTGNAPASIAMKQCADLPVGASLLEVMVSLLVFVMGILAIAGLSLQALRQNRTAYLQTRATVQVASMFERLRVNHSFHGRQTALRRWRRINQQLLVNVYGNYSCIDHGQHCTVNLRWQSGHLVVQSRV